MLTGSLSGLSSPAGSSQDRARAAGRRAVVGAVLVAALTSTVVVGWYARSDSMIRLGFGGTLPMRMNTAVWLLALAMALVSRWAPLRWVLLSAVGGSALVTILEYRLSVDAGIDQLLVRDWATAQLLAPGRPSESTSVAVISLAAGLAVAPTRHRRTAQALLLAPLGFAMLTIYGYAFGSTALYRLGPYSAVAFGTGLVVVVLAAVALLTVPGGVAEWTTFGRDPGARLMRWLVPTALLAAPFAAWLIDKGHARGYYDAPMELALVISFVALLMVVIGYGVGRRALALDRERDTLLGELQRVNDDLEDRVRVRSHQLNRQRTKLTLFEERDRIARDLHDRVIQRIFAAGLQVGALSRTVAKGTAVTDVAENLDLVATELDLAIRELRNSIFQLTSVDDQDDLEQVMHDVAARASRILGFMPHLQVEGNVGATPGELVVQIASVMQEGLSNIARHAQASAAEVAVEVADGHVQIRIADDGIGLPDPLPRSSGISNLISRARSLGGTATWANGPSTGTVLTWRAPLDRELADDADGLSEDHGYEIPVAICESDHSPAASSAL